MNLGKLLSAGKSVFGGGANKSYREDRRVYLPKFNSGKNPFVAKPAEVPAAPAPAPEKTSEPAAPRAAVVTGGATAVKAPEMSVTAAPRPVRSNTWAEKLNPFRAAKPVAPPMVNAVQTELSLDAVKPITNDLADADIEVVPVKSCTVVAQETPLIPVSRGTWEFAGVRVTKPI
jgi:hypothetical protein